MTTREQAKGERCNCTAYARWISRLNGEVPGAGYYRNPRCPEHQGNSFPDREAQQAELRATALETTREAQADAWDAGFEAGHCFKPSGPSGVPHDPPRNPYRADELDGGAK